MLDDADQRQQALAVDKSFIVQAPAGSGKTTLLTQRYLALLAKVTEPEEIIAITFTKKAAAEMRERILAALTEPSAHPQTARLALAALEQDARLNWQILANPQRLRIQTIDSFNLSLMQNLPLHAKIGATPQLTQQASRLYHQAIDALFAELEVEPAVQEALSTILLHLDNRVDRIKYLFSRLLSCRDQWLIYLGVKPDLTYLRQYLERNLCHIREDLVSSLTSKIKPYDIDSINTIINYQRKHLDQQELFYFNPQQLEGWQIVANLLLTKQGDWRKTFNKKIGLPALSQCKTSGEKIERQKIQSLIEQLIINFDEQNSIKTLLNDCLQCPPDHYLAKQWQLIAALLFLLPRLVAHLQVSFSQHNCFDFSEIGLRALQALGSEDEPTDLALLLDYQIQHVLIDEFQDTSNLQFLLLSRLIQGWQMGDGHSLFLVGDPMQSIYRFRQAEVGLFIQVRQQGIAAIKPIALQLTSNFRSQANLVNWYNATFSHLFPCDENKQTGAIRYTNAQAVCPSMPHAGVTFHSTANSGDAIVQLIQTITAQQAKAKIAILVQARSHLTDITPALNHANIAYRAIEIETLFSTPIVQDLLALTRGIYNVADRVAWFAILRSPYVGLQLADILELGYQNTTQTLWQRLSAIQQYHLSDDAKIRLQRFLPVMSRILEQRGEQDLVQQVESIWLALGGPCVAKTSVELNYAEHYFRLLKQHLVEYTEFDLFSLEQQLQHTAIENQTALDYQVEIMTIHKAKGLEFDIVILPGLEKTLAHDESQLLLWMEYLYQQNSELIIAPIKASSEKQDPIYQYVYRQQREKAQLEMLRLLYVATTRAKQQLHLLITVNEEEDSNILKVNKNSFAYLLYDEFSQVYSQTEQKDVPYPNKLGQKQPLPQRLPANWQLPESLQDHQFSLTQPAFDNSHYQFTLTDNKAKAIGELTHFYLQQIAEIGLENCQQAQLNQFKLGIKSQLPPLGIWPEQLETCLQTIMCALENTIHDQRGRWILANHQQARCEWAISTLIQDNHIKHYRIDRSFIDEQGTHWLIDYKVITETNVIDHEKYLPQLQRYAQLLQELTDHTIALGLYFPLQKQWWQQAVSA